MNLHKKPTYCYSNLLTSVHRRLNRILGCLIDEDITIEKKEVNIAIQYLKDAGILMNKAETILYKNMF